MSERIEVQYDELESLISSVDGKTQEMQQMMQTLNNQIDVLRGGAWIGTNADKFYQEMGGDAMPGVNRLVQALGEMAGTIRTLINTYQTAEEEAQAAFPSA